MTQIRALMVFTLLVATMLIATSAPASAGEEKLLNINTASAADLAGLKGIGDAKAKAIVQYREKNGPFKSVEDLRQVKGIGEKLLENLRAHVTVGSTAPAAAAKAAAPAAHH
jgi:competence protein ComEA